HIGQHPARVVIVLAVAVGVFPELPLPHVLDVRCPRQGAYIDCRAIHVVYLHTTRASRPIGLSGVGETITNPFARTSRVLERTVNEYRLFRTQRLHPRLPGGIADTEGNAFRHDQIAGQCAHPVISWITTVQRYLEAAEHG